ncbi:AsmA-like C-terminal region-containing protein [Rhizobium helianthi]|uniref:AsmA-like C-terminal region-containing protein n=1 Tax=Rhizobium helianthi TaxID=1132695 RepID=A0ABW4M601_9HYPH
MNQHKPRHLLTSAALLASLLVLAGILAFRVFSPSLISSALVRERMEASVEEWLGHDILIAAEPDLSFWPRPVVTLRDITIRTQDRADAAIIGHVEALSARFSIWQALRGAPVFEDFTLVGPHILLKRNAKGQLNWGTDGLLGQALREAAERENASGAPSDDPVIGDITIVQGSVLLSDAAGRSLSITQIEGSLDWARLSASARLRMKGMVNEQSVALDISTAAPLMLLAGHSAQVDASLQSPLVSATFSGSADLARYAFFAGDLRLSVPKVADVVTWANLPIHIADRLTDFSLSARLVTLGHVLRFDQLSIGANGTTGSGVMDLSMATQTSAPRVTGTLAFDAMNLGDLVTAISGQSDEDVEPPARPDFPPFERQLGFDVRFSASKVEFGLLNMTNAAVSVVSDSERAQVEILDADLFGGNLTGDVSMTNEPAVRTALNLKARDVNLAQLAKALNLGNSAISGTGNLSARFFADEAIRGISADDIQGQIQFNAKNGTLPAIDLTRLETLAGGTSYFELKQLRRTSLDFDTLDVKADINSGTAEIQSFLLHAAPYRLALSGTVPYLTRSLFLTGELENTSSGKAAHGLLVGGVWPNPVIWPSASPARLAPTAPGQP